MVCEEGDEGTKETTGNYVGGVVAVVCVGAVESEQERREMGKGRNNAPIVRLTAIRVAATGGVVAIQALTV